jgi:hypothetical protein
MSMTTSECEGRPVRPARFLFLGDVNPQGWHVSGAETCVGEDTLAACNFDGFLRNQAYYVSVLIPVGAIRDLYLHGLALSGASSCHTRAVYRLIVPRPGGGSAVAGDSKRPGRSRVCVDAP